MTLTNKQLISLLAAGLLLIGVVLGQIFQADEAKGDILIGTTTYATSTPALANNTVLCSGTGILDSIIHSGARTGYLWVVNATTTIHSDFATSTRVVAEVQAGYSTSTAFKYGVEVRDGIMVTYTGAGTTTITYRCGS